MKMRSLEAWAIDKTNLDFVLRSIYDMAKHVSPFFSNSSDDRPRVSQIPQKARSVPVKNTF